MVTHSEGYSCSGQAPEWATFRSSVHTVPVSNLLLPVCTEELSDRSLPANIIAPRQLNSTLCKDGEGSRLRCKQQGAFGICPKRFPDGGAWSFRSAPLQRWRGR